MIKRNLIATALILMGIGLSPASAQQVNPGSSASTSAAASVATATPVKKSKTGICHAPGTTYYARTKNYTPYATLNECLNSGGRLPKR